MLFINFILCGLVYVLNNIFNYQHLSRYFGNDYPMLAASIPISKLQVSQAVRIRRSVCLVARYTPWNSNCLVQAMVALIWCKYYKIPYLLFIGFAKKSEKPLGKDAHAWVTAGPIAITGGQSFDSHLIVYTFSNRTLTMGKIRK